MTPSLKWSLITAFAAFFATLTGPQDRPLFAAFVAFFLLVLHFFKNSRFIETFDMRSLSFNWSCILLNSFILGGTINGAQDFMTSFLFQKSPFTKEVHSIALGHPFFLILFGLFVGDAWGWLRHRLFHLKPLSFFHRMHHSDPDCDVTTHWRFHIVESTFVVMTDIGVLILCGFPLEIAEACVLLRSAWGYVLHSREFAKSDFGFFKSFLVTPADHRYHHGTGHASNYSSIFNIFDKLAGTWRPSTGSFEEVTGVPSVSGRNFFEELLGVTLKK